MYLLLFILVLSGLISCFLIVLIFGLLRAGRRADEVEESILRIISPTMQSSVNKQNRQAAWSVSKAVMKS